jgi:hypothetical protein
MFTALFIVERSWYRIMSERKNITEEFLPLPFGRPTFRSNLLLPSVASVYVSDSELNQNKEAVNSSESPLILIILHFYSRCSKSLRTLCRVWYWPVCVANVPDRILLWKHATDDGLLRIWNLRLTRRWMSVVVFWALTPYIFRPRGGKAYQHTVWHGIRTQVITVGTLHIKTCSFDVWLKVRQMDVKAWCTEAVRCSCFWWFKMQNDGLWMNPPTNFESPRNKTKSAIPSTWPALKSSAVEH